jgi:hypothetical protein
MAGKQLFRVRGEEMAVQVRLSSFLRRLADGQKRVTAADNSVEVRRLDACAFG